MAFLLHVVDVGVGQTTSSQPVMGEKLTQSGENVYEYMKGRDSRSGDESTPHFLTNPMYGAVESESAFQGSYGKVSPAASIEMAHKLQLHHANTHISLPLELLLPFKKINPRVFCR